jgi:hypothetical protein
MNMFQYDTCSGSGISIGSEPWEIIRSLCPLPHLKCLHIDHISSRFTLGHLYKCLHGIVV